MITRSIFFFLIYYIYIHTTTSLDRHIVAFWLGRKKYEKILKKQKL